MSIKSGRFSVKLFAAIAALSLVGSGVAIADETADTPGVPGGAVSAQPSAPEVTPSAEPTDVESVENNGEGVQLADGVDGSDVFWMLDGDFGEAFGGALPACSADFGKFSLKGPSTLVVGQVEQTLVTLVAENGEQFNLPHDYFDRMTVSLWSSSNTSVATVNKYGDVTGKAPGTATITLASEAERISPENVVTKCRLAASFTVMVVQPVVKVSSVSVSGKSNKVQVGKKLALKASVAPDNATDKGVAWKSSNTKVATVGSSGVVTGKKTGTVTITATARDGSGKSGSFKVTVVKPTVKVSSVKVSGASKVTVGKSVQLKVSIAPSNAANKSVGWKSSNTKIATVNAKGVVKGIKPGTVTITATAKDGSKKKASFKVTVEKVSTVQKVYRLYNKATSEHLFTTDAKEYKVLAAKHGWKKEGVAWVAPKTSKTPVYRLYNKRLGDHHYTASKKEASKLVKQYGWRYDNGGKPVFYSDDKKRVKVYRQYNGRLKVGQHHYTAKASEARALVKKYGWKNEGVAWYAVKLK